MRLPNLKQKGVSGFTLVEMAIVLVIIGIILAGVMKGRDIVRGAQVKQFSQQFGQKWATIAQTYYDKTGQFLMDGQINAGVNGDDPNGLMDGNLFNGAGVAVRLTTALTNVGIEGCTIVKSRLAAGLAFNGATPNDHCGGSGTAATADRVNIVQTQVDGEYVQGAIVSVEPVGLNITFPGTVTKVLDRNCIALYGIPVDVAIGLDTLIDGQANGFIGGCVYDSTSGTAPTGGSGTAGGTDLAEADAIVTDAWPPAVVGGVGQVVNAIIVLDF